MKQRIKDGWLYFFIMLSLIALAELFWGERDYTEQTIRDKGEIQMMKDAEGELNQIKRGERQGKGVC